MNALSDVLSYDLVTASPFLKPGEIAIRIIRDCCTDQYLKLSGNAADNLLELYRAAPDEEHIQRILRHAAEIAP